jgi:dTDP-4-dehydrorhamnose 3,5-epimerase
MSLPILEPLEIPDAYLIRMPGSSDARGSFVKTFHADAFEAAGVSFQLKEAYYSVSSKGVIRGMHFQNPPAAHAKIVCCPVGEILDVIVDLRAGSPMYGKAVSVNLSAENRQGVFVPLGCAHGFCALTEGAMTCYSVSTVYDPKQDTGILFSSFGFSWPVDQPVLSDRDRSFARLADLQTPFVYRGTNG